MALPRTVALCSFRLGGTDGVSIEAAKWVDALRALGIEVVTIAGDGYADRLIPGLEIRADRPIDEDALRRALDDAELVVVENICSLPLNPEGAAVLAKVLRGQHALFHHHDLALERVEFVHLGPPPDDPTWGHVCINAAAVTLLAKHEISAELCYNCFDTSPARAHPGAARDALGIGADERLVLQPTRAIPRKNVAGGVALAEALGATFWLTGPAEDAFGPELERIFAGARTRVVHAPIGDLALGYSAADLVILPSFLEGFGNPAIEGVLHGRPVAVGPYPTAKELTELGFRFLDATDPDGVDSALGDAATLEADAAANLEAARRHLDLHDLPIRLERLLRRLF